MALSVDILPSQARARLGIEDTPDSSIVPEKRVILGMWPGSYVAENPT
jgi:hypothetical protein